MEISNNISFGAKFVENKDFIAVADYAFSKHRMDLFNEALQNIDRIRKDTFIKMDLCYTDKKPTVVFSRYEKGWNHKLQKQTDKYVLKRQVDYIAENEKLNPLKMAFDKIIKMGNNKARNNTFDYVVIEKEQSKKPYFLF
ncbi:hypothetical protein IJ674_00875 [bacterium]|nr:hypothetical protein [bacterium]MBR1618428.1 hypothetical protein [bacterium]